MTPQHRRRRVAVKLEIQFLFKRHTGIFAGVQKYAREQGWESIVDEFAEDTLARSKQSRPYDGVIARVTPKLAKRVAELKVPTVNTWFNSPVAARLTSVFEDFAAIGRLRAEHLVSRGLTRFAVSSCGGDRGIDLEIEHFKKYLNEAGFDCSEASIVLDAGASAKAWRAGERQLAEWMKHWKLPIGVFVALASQGRIVAQTCLNRGWRVPEDVAIITGRNELEFCQEPQPSLTSVEIGFERIGYQAAQLLDGLMNGKAPPPKPILVPPVGLVVRESTDFVSVDDPTIAAALKFIAAHSHQNISQHEVATAVAVEVRTLQRRFQKILNRSIGAEIRRVRIERAKRLLVASDMSIKQIARDLGFGSPLRIYEVFRREVGMTPSQFRRERQAHYRRG